MKYSVKLGLSLHHCQWVASFWSGFDLGYSVLSNLRSSHMSCSFGLALAGSLVSPNRKDLNGIKAAYPTPVLFQSH